ncbi:aldo/keto reductase [Chloroflexota bacterium]
MDYSVLGHTGIRVSALGLGCGGPSSLGQKSGKTRGESVAVIKQALDSGINFIDTAEEYGTEEFVGDAIRTADRNSLVLSTKKTVFNGITPEQVQKGLEESLKRLGTEYIDIYHLHRVILEDYDYLASEIVPLLQQMRESGKIRFLGITEGFNSDLQHTMLQRALQDDIWDVMMVGFHILNQSARDSVLKNAIQKDIGIVVMQAARPISSQPDQVKRLINQLIEKNQLKPSDIDYNNPFDFLIRDSGAANLADLAYRFCHYEPGTHVILSGTGNSTHLEANIESFSRPPLPQEYLEKIKNMFQ